MFVMPREYLSISCWRWRGALYCVPREISWLHEYISEIGGIRCYASIEIYILHTNTYNFNISICVDEVICWIELEFIVIVLLQ